MSADYFYFLSQWVHNWHMLRITTWIDPRNYDFEVSKRNYAVPVQDSYVHIKNVIALLGNNGNNTYDYPFGNGVFRSESIGTVFDNCEARFGRSFEIVLTKESGRTENSIAEFNNSTGLYAIGSDAAKTHQSEVRR